MALLRNTGSKGACLLLDKPSGPSCPLSKVLTMGFHMTFQLRTFSSGGAKDDTWGLWLTYSPLLLPPCSSGFYHSQGRWVLVMPSKGTATHSSLGISIGMSVTRLSAGR